MNRERNVLMESTSIVRASIAPKEAISSCFTAGRLADDKRESGISMSARANAVRDRLSAMRKTSAAANKKLRREPPAHRDAKSATPNSANRAYERAAMNEMAPISSGPKPSDRKTMR